MPGQNTSRIFDSVTYKSLKRNKTKKRNNLEENIPIWFARTCCCPVTGRPTKRSCDSRFFDKFAMGKVDFSEKLFPILKSYIIWYKSFHK